MTNFVKRIVPVVLLLATVAFAADPVALKPPAGAKVAIVEFVDLECPMCAHAAPIVKEASDKYSIPLIRHDFPLPMHAWSRRAAVIARYFDTKSVPVANDFRDYIFAHQREVEPGTLLSMAKKFATDHKIDLPFQVDPTGALEKKVNEDYALGQSLGVDATPAIWVVGNGVPPQKLQSGDISGGSARLYQIIESVQQQVEANTPKTASKKATKKKS